MIADDVILDIVDAKFLGEYKIQISFSDGLKRVVDFKQFLQSAFHPDIKKYLDTKLFEQFTIDGGDLVWNDYELCFPLNDLYDGTI